MLVLKKLFLSLILLFSSFEVLASSEIEQIDTLNVIKESHVELNEDVLIVFDVDEVIFTDKDAILRPIGDVLKFRIFNEKYAQAHSPSEKDHVTTILSIPLEMAEKKLVEDWTADWIHSLQDRSVKVIALTSCPTRPFGVIKDFEKWRLSHLNLFGIDFQTSFPKVNRFVLSSLSSACVPPPVYNQGVLFAEGFTKADVLCEFLKAIDYQPKLIIFVDDLYSNLQQMQKKLKERNIPFKGYYYVKVRKDSEKDLDEKLARYQFDYLFKHQQWLSDEEAASKIQEKAI